MSQRPNFLAKVIVKVIVKVIAKDVRQFVIARQSSMLSPSGAGVLSSNIQKRSLSFLLTVSLMWIFSNPITLRSLRGVVRLIEVSGHWLLQRPGGDV